jgi:3-hydroxybutyryl-CoA dehydrogenase
LSAATRLGVVGAGAMGTGIAELGCVAGIDTVLLDSDQAALDRSIARIEERLERVARRGRLDDPAAAPAHLSVTAQLAALAECDLVIEAVPERLDVKHEVVGTLSRVCTPDAVIATNTSSLAVTDIAIATSHPDRVIGMHFFNPAPVMALVELVGTPQGSAAALECGADGPLEWGDAIGLEHVVAILDFFALDERYRVAPLLAQAVSSGGRLAGG